MNKFSNSITIYKNIRHCFLDLQTYTSIFFNSVVQESKEKSWKQAELTKSLTYLEMAIEEYFIDCLLEAPDFEFFLRSQESEILEEMSYTLTKLERRFITFDLINYSVNTQIVGRKMRIILSELNKLIIRLLNYV